MRLSLSLTALLLSVSSFTTVHAQGWTLDDCIKYALENNIQVQQAQNSVETAEADVKSSRAALFPSLSFSSSQSLGFQKIESQSYSTFDAEQKNPTYNGSYNLSANMTLFDGGANWRTLKQSKLNKQASELEAQQTANNIQVQIIQAYYQILYAHESVQTNEEIVAVAQRELDRTKAKLDVGKGTKVDVAQMESQLQQNMYNLVNAQNTEASNILSLMQLLQLNPDTNFTINYQDFSDEDVLSVIPPVADAILMAQNYLPDVKAAEINTKSAELQTKIAKAGYMPSVSLNGGVSSSNGNVYKNGFADQIKDHMRENIGVSVSVPILDNRRTRTSIDRAKIQYSNALLNQENALLKLQNTIASLHLDILSAQSRYQSAIASEASAKESFEMMEERYNVGLESVIDLLTEKNNYLRAKQETLQSKYTALMDLELMDFYTGQ
ncbi:MAG: TolC family protein [Bacteroidales bacterium]|nr:TolC family protein [Bacteroidales bacterium]